MANEFYVEIAQQLGQETAEQLREFFDKQHFKVGASLSEESIKEIQNQLENLSIDINMPEFNENIQTMFSELSAGMSVLNEDLKDITGTTKELNDAKLKEQRAENFELTSGGGKGLSPKDFQRFQSQEDATTLLAGNIGKLVALVGAGIAVAGAAEDNKRLLQLSKTTGTDLEFLQKFATSVIGSEGISSTSDAINVVSKFNETLSNLRTGKVSQGDLQTLRTAGVNVESDLNIENLISGFTNLADRFDKIDPQLQGPVSRIFKELTGTSVLDFRSQDRERNIFLESEENEDLNESLRKINIEFKFMSNELLRGINPALKSFSNFLTPLGKAVGALASVMASVSNTLAFRFGSEEEQVTAALDIFKSGKASDIVIPSNIQNKAITDYFFDTVSGINVSGDARKVLTTGNNAADDFINKSNLANTLGQDFKLDSSDLSDNIKTANKQRAKMIMILNETNRIKNDELQSNRPQSVIGQIIGGQ